MSPPEAGPPRAPADRPASGPWHIWIDTGGTFTDCIAHSPRGDRIRVKVLSSSALRGRVVGVDPSGGWVCDLGTEVPPGFLVGAGVRVLGSTDPLREVVDHRGPPSTLTLAPGTGAAPEPGTPIEILFDDDAPLLAARLATNTPPGQPLPPCAFRLATTRGTNALLQGLGAPTALFITAGFGDLLRIGSQARPDLFALNIRKAPPLTAEVVEVSERVGADGTIITSLDLDALAADIDRVLDQGIVTAAVCLLNSPHNPDPERRLGEHLRRRGFQSVSISSDLSPLIRILPRAETAVVNATLTPVMRDFLDRVAEGMGESTPGEGEVSSTSTLRVMTSAGGLVGADRFLPKDGLLSGPAGGVVGSAVAGRHAGFEKVLAFDMGGTSTDVSRYDGDHVYRFEHRVGDAHLVAPALAIETVAAGGGSICGVDDGLFVGPRSAGADPGPAAYGSGGPLTLTDVNLLLGRLDPHRFQIPIDVGAAAQAFAAVRNQLEAVSGETGEPEALLEGFLDIANERMADAIRKVSVAEGVDPTDHALVAFGGAGGQHACGIADSLGVDVILAPTDAGILSAIGLGGAVVERFTEEQVLAPLSRVGPELTSRFEGLDRRALELVRQEADPDQEIAVRRRLVNLRFMGQDQCLTLDYSPTTSLAEGFADAHRALYGHRPPAREIEVESIRSIASTGPQDPLASVTRPERSPTEGGAVPAPGRQRAFIGGRWRDVPTFSREAVAAEEKPVTGPAIVFDAHSALVVEDGWRVRHVGEGSLEVTRHRAGEPGSPLARSRSESVRLELFIGRCQAMAEEMGELLRRTALSTNVKERLDFSCGILDPDGQLIVNAPHIPVHLGALGLCVREVRASLSMLPGDVVVTNHPACGGSHLPDITVLAPVHARDGTLLGYVASRAHHAEIGGMVPGSMPPHATHLAEEGVVLPPTRLIRGGEADWATIERHLRSGPWPSRAPEENLADLRAQVAAILRGREAVAELGRAFGADATIAFMRALAARAEDRVRSALGARPDGVVRAVESLDDGADLAVAITIAGNTATLDFTGTAPVHPGNLNATPAIVHSVIIYVLRLLIDEPLPLNEGLLRPVTIRIPPGMLSPHFPDDPGAAPAVGGGNVETSQRLVDTLIRALGLSAAGQGTMNNVIFGNDRFSYYETVGGGAGAGPGFAGADAVHTHMTNTRITDLEVLEHRYPVRVHRFAIRPRSGGAGTWSGGNGIVRAIEFLDRVQLSIVSQRRRSGPFGMSGGTPGRCGRQWIERGKDVVLLDGIDGRELSPGDLFVLETPGGGGFGPPS